MDELINSVIHELKEKYNPHTIILYGSRARNEETETSDIDVACFTDNSPELKDARLFNGVYLDAWVYPTEAMNNVSDGSLRFGDGRCLFDQRGLGRNFLSKVQEKITSGPIKLSESDQSHMVEWISKMLLRIETEDLEGRHRRCWLQFELLEIYFQLRGLWFFGPKKSLSFLKANDEVAYQLFSDVYQNPTNLENLKKLANHVVSV